MEFLDNILNSKFLRKHLFKAGLAGFFLSLTVHLAAWLGLPQGGLITGWLLISVFSIWFLGERAGPSNEAGETFHNQFFSISLNSRPPEMDMLMAVCFVYCFLNFLVNFPFGEVENKDGLFLLTERGKVIKTLTKQEFIEAQCQSVRFESNLALLFYASFINSLFPKKD
ncbi:MAG: hypothetical protein ACK4Q5_20620 [Saprospiraceae bacterium]